MSFDVLVSRPSISVVKDKTKTKTKIRCLERFFNFRRELFDPRHPPSAIRDSSLPCSVVYEVCKNPASNLCSTVL